MTEDYSKCLKSCRGKCERVCFSKSIQTCVSVFDGFCFLLTRRCVSSPCQVCRSFPSCQLAQACSRVSQRVVCEEGRSLKLNPPVRRLTQALIATQFRQIHNEGANAPCGEPEQEQDLQFLMTPDPTSSVMCIILLSCSLHFFLLLLFIMA